MEAVEVGGDVNVDDVTFLQRPAVRYAWCVLDVRV